MKVFNLTDVVTPQLRRQGLSKISIRVGEVIIPPGEHREVKDTLSNRKFVQQRFESRGALSIGKVPKGYSGTADQVREEVRLPSPPPPSPTEPPPPLEEPVPEPLEEPVPDTLDGAAISRAKTKKRGSRRGS